MPLCRKDCRHDERVVRTGEDRSSKLFHFLGADLPVRASYLYTHTVKELTSSLKVRYGIS